MAVGHTPATFDCDNCKWGRHCDADGAMRGSRGPASMEHIEIQAIGFKSNICPKPMITDHSRWLIRLYNHYSKGILYTGGGIADQPADYMAAMELIGNLLESFPKE